MIEQNGEWGMNVHCVTCSTAPNKKLRLEGISEKCNYKSGDSCTVSQWLIIVHNLHSMFTLGLIWALKNENKTFCVTVLLLIATIVLIS